MKFMVLSCVRWHYNLARRNNDAADIDGIDGCLLLNDFSAIDRSGGERSILGGRSTKTQGCGGCSRFYAKRNFGRKNLPQRDERKDHLVELFCHMVTELPEGVSFFGKAE